MYWLLRRNTKNSWRCVIWWFWTAFVRIGLANAFLSSVTGKEAEQDGAEWPVRGGTFATTTRTVSICDRKVQRCSGVNIIKPILMSRRVCWASRTLGILEFCLFFFFFLILEFYWQWLWFGKWDSGFSIFIFSFSPSFSFHSIYDLWSIAWDQKIYIHVCNFGICTKLTRRTPKTKYKWVLVTDCCWCSPAITPEYSSVYASKCIYNADPDKNVSPIVAQTDTDSCGRCSHSILYTFHPRAILVGPLGGICPSAITR